MKIVVPAEVSVHKMNDLPVGVHLQPGELRIEFHGAEELLERLYELSQTMLNDYQRFGEICEPEVRAPSAACPRVPHESNDVITAVRAGCPSCQRTIGSSDSAMAASRVRLLFI